MPKPANFALTPLVSIVIVNYNSDKLLRQNITSLHSFIRGQFEVIVVDNNSGDDSLDDLIPENLNIVRNQANVGFARACNQGARIARGTILHFLNPDAQVTENINDCYVSAVNKPNEIFVTRVQNTRSSSQKSSYLIPTFSNMVRSLFNRSKVAYWYIGASVVLSQSLFKQLGGWTEDYFMYAEDMDFFYKAHLAGVRTNLSDSLVLHEQGGTTHKVWSTNERLERVERSAFIFATKYALHLDYFIFRHIALVKMLFNRPKSAVAEILVYYALLKSELAVRLKATSKG